MFTIQQILAAHRKVRSGADFPAYIRDLKELGVIYYETFVADGHTDYYGDNNFKATSLAKYELLSVSAIADKAKFSADLKLHQQGKTDYRAFIEDAADSGVEKWAVSIAKMSCTYFDRIGKEILVESIPQ